MGINFAITVHDEVKEIEHLIIHLRNHAHFPYRIIVQQDTKDTPQAKKVTEYLKQQDDIFYITYTFQGDFSDFKNNLNNHCHEDYIFQIDADEYPSEFLLKNLPQLLDLNPGVDLFFLPRVNTVEGITPEHIQRWGWRYEGGLVNYPDYQGRIYRNDPERIKWVGRVHEKIQGHRTYTYLPALKGKWDLYHSKTIERQEKQNELYSKL